MKIIAITSCPVGMAHTYMAAASFKKMAKKLGHEIRVETQGSMGIRDKLSKEEIDSADLLIDAADVAIIESERFKDVLTYKTTTSKVIKKTKAVFEEALKLVKQQ